MKNESKDTIPVKELKSNWIAGRERVCEWINNNVKPEDLVSITGSNDTYTIFYWRKS